MVGESDGFLARVRELPDDDGPRLVYADWLDEQDDPRGEFIRIQIALAKLPPFDSRADELQRVEQEMLARFGEEWSAPFQGIASGPVFRRGFVEEVNVAARPFLAHPDAVFAVAPVRHLHLLDLGSHLTEVFACAQLAKLTRLTVYAQYLGEPLARAIAESQHLTGLQRLALGRNRIGDAGVEQLLASESLPNLEDFDLSENDLSEVGARSLAMNARWPNLRRLELAGNAIGPVGADELLGSPQRPRLERIGLSGTRLSGTRLLTLMKPLGLHHLHAADLSGNDLTAGSLPRLFLEAPSHLRELDLSRNELGNAGAAWLASATQVAGLRVLRLAVNQITDEGLIALSRSTSLTRLTALDLSNNPIGDDGFRALLESPTFRHLRRLTYPNIGLSFRMRLALETRFNRDGRATW